MIRRLKYLIPLLLLLKIHIGMATEIRVDKDFSSQDLFNTLSDSVVSTHSELTYQLNLRNISGQPRQLYISFINPTINRIVVLEHMDSTVLGDLIPFTKRKFKHVNHVYPVLLDTDSSRSITLKVYNSTRHNLNFRMNLAAENTFIKTTNHDYFFNGIVYGILFMYLLLLICFYIFSKSNFFTIYLAINLFMLLLLMQYNGAGYQFIWFFSSGIQKYITMFAATGYLFSHILFIRTFFSVQFNTISKYLSRIFLMVAAIAGLLFLMQLYIQSSGYTNTNIYFLAVTGIFMLYGLVVLILCVYTYLESGNREVIWVLVGMLFHICNWAIFINNEFAVSKWLNEIDNFKVFASNIFVPQLNYFITLLEILVVTIFISINYHKLIRQNNLSSQRLEFLQKRNINTFVLGQEEEREKITSQIEADISKDIQRLRTALTGFKLHQDEKKIIPTVLNEIDKTLTDIKNITGNYVAPDMQQLLLTELIITATDKLFQEVSTVYDFKNIPEDFKLNAVANINLYRVLQEISNNAMKHSEAKNIRITAIRDAKTLQLKISDDGVGFAANAGKIKGIGLMNIESRMNSLNGNFYLLSNENKGTTIHLIMPLKEIC